jgi:hypothetical protein
MYEHYGAKRLDCQIHPCRKEILDSNRITKWNWETGSESPLRVAEGCASNNGTKSTPCLCADLLGDWREEVLWRTTRSIAGRCLAERRLQSAGPAGVLPRRRDGAASAATNVCPVRGARKVIGVMPVLRAAKE